MSTPYDIEQIETVRTFRHPDLGTFIITKERDNLYSVSNECGLRWVKYDSFLSAENAIRAVIPFVLTLKEYQALESSAYAAADEAWCQTAVVK